MSADRFSRPIDAGKCPACLQKFEATGIYGVGQITEVNAPGAMGPVAPVTLLGVSVKAHNCTPAPIRSESTVGAHSRACGIRQHEHGTGCARDCPTCHGRLTR
jgi:hypothetical protein